MNPANGDAPGAFLPWDSDFFGFRIGRANRQQLTEATLSELLAWSRVEKLRCLYLSADAACPVTLECAHAGGFKFVDLRVDFTRPLAAGAKPESIDGLRTATADDLPALVRMSRLAHQDTRFFKDPKFPAERAADLYSEWIRRDFREHTILVAGDSNDLRGYVTCQVDRERQVARIGLIAVAEAERGRGLGRQLVAGAQESFRLAGCREVRVATQGSNLAAQRLYQGAGFRTGETSATFHRWF